MAGAGVPAEVTRLAPCPGGRTPGPEGHRVEYAPSIRERKMLRGAHWVVLSYFSTNHDMPTQEKRNGGAERIKRLKWNQSMVMG
jgi:hypothetical protein